MDTSRPFTRHFAHLVWLFLREPGSTYEQQVVLAQLVDAAKETEVMLALTEEGLRANGVLVPYDLKGVPDLMRQMGLHGLAMISADAGATPSDLFGVAGIVAAMPVLDDDAQAVEEKRLEIGVKSVRFVARSRGRRDTTMSTPPRATNMMTALPDIELGDVFQDPLGEARSRATPRSTQSLNLNTPAHGVGTGHFTQFAAPLTPREPLDELLKQFDTTDDPTEISRLLGALAILAEDAAHAGRAPVACRIMSHMARREPQIQDADSRRSCGLTLSRLGRPDVLRVIATQMPRYPDSREDYIGVLGRAGENGADAILERLSAEEQQKDRRVYFDALVQLRAGIPGLLQMLKDNRWYVVRNAAELLGEMKVSRAEFALTDLQKHPDERVSRAAKTALMRLGTPRSLAAIEDVFKSGDVQFRMDAASALVGRKGERATQTLLHALDGERDSAVQVALLGALGKVASPEAVQRLVRSAEPGGSLFRKKTTDFRVAATHALADAGTPEALDALRALQADKEPDVRAAATLSLGRATRRATTSVKPILSEQGQ